MPSDLIIEETTKNTQLLNWENIKLEILCVVYFDQLLGAARTQNLVKILFLPFSTFFVYFQTFVSDFQPFVELYAHSLPE